jgi:hypothetical protein
MYLRRASDLAMVSVHPSDQLDAPAAAKKAVALIAFINGAPTCSTVVD